MKESGWKNPIYLTKAPITWKKLFRLEMSLAYPSLPQQANFSYTSSQNLENRVHEKQNIGSARRVMWC